MRRLLSLGILIPMIVLVTLAGCERPSEKENVIKESNNNNVKITRVEELPSFADLVEKLEPSVVNISTTSVLEARGYLNFPSPSGKENPFEEFFKRFFGGQLPQHQFRQHTLGSGFIISPDGYVVTNNHVIDRAKDIQVTLADGESYEGKIVGRDPKTDLALLKIQPKEKLQAVEFGNSDKLRIGDWVIAIGNPFGLGNTVTAGIVSAKGRILGLGNYDDFIQTDAPINPGNSGGPLFDLAGELVGVNTAIVAGGQGIGFSIPSNLVRNVVDQLETKGKVVRGWLGVLAQQVTPEIAEGMNLKEPKGALVADVTPDSPAQKAGIKRGDVIVALNGHEIGNVSDLTDMVAMTPPDTQIKLKVIRGGKEKEISVVVGELPEKTAGKMEETKKETEQKLGLSVEEINPQIARRFNLSEEKGVFITDVVPGSLADQAGFRAGDVILEINRRAIKNIGDYKSAIENLEKGKSTIFLIKRGENTLYVGIKIG
jgi:serine protease Do